MVEYHPISAKDTSRLHQFGPKVLPGVFLGYAGGIWKEDIMVADIEELEVMDAPELHARRFIAKEVLTPERSGNFIFPVADGTVKIFGREQRLRTSTLTLDHPERGEELEVLQGKSDELHSPTPLQEDSTRDDEEAKSDFWTLTGEFIYRHRVVPRVELYMPKEESLPIPINHTNVIPTNIDHMPSNTKNSGSCAVLYVFEDNEAVIKMITKGRSPTMRHVSRTHTVALDWLFDKINLDPKIQIRHIDTKHQLADMLTKGNFTLD